MIINIFNNNIYYMKIFSKNKNKLETMSYEKQIKEHPRTMSNNLTYQQKPRIKQQYNNKKIKYFDDTTDMPNVEILSKYKSFSLGLYSIQNYNTQNPFLMYLFDVRKDTSIFPI